MRGSAEKENGIEKEKTDVSLHTRFTDASTQTKLYRALERPGFDMSPTHDMDWGGPTSSCCHIENTLKRWENDAKPPPPHTHTSQFSLGSELYLTSSSAQAAATSSSAFLS